MKKAIYLLVGILIFSSCKEKPKAAKEKPVSKFDLVADLTNFREQMTELDTIMIWFDHSVCTYQGYEQIEITKQSDSIHIVCYFKELTFQENPKWARVYDKKISEKDTIWKFEQFIMRIEKWKSTEQNNRGILILTDHKDTISYSIDGLGDFYDFQEDYFETMRKICPENKKGIYSLEVVED